MIGTGRLPPTPHVPELRFAPASQAAFCLGVASARPTSASLAPSSARYSFLSVRLLLARLGLRPRARQAPQAHRFSMLGLGLGIVERIRPFRSRGVPFASI